MISGARTEVRDFNFSFDRDTFAFPNELVWEYRFDPATGKVRTLRNEPTPRYAHRCFVMVRSARQFLYHARFAPDQPVADDAAYRRLIRTVVRRSARRPSPPAAAIIIPGFPDLRTFSRDRADLLRDECGAAWESYVLRSHWRMVFPISRGHQQRMAEQLTAALTARPAPIAHLVRFPQLTINHALLLYGRREVPGGLEFAAYDPNVPAEPARLEFDFASQTFSLPRNHYWAGGAVNVIEVYRGWFY